MQPVEIYLTRWCPFCSRAIMLLEHKGVSYNAIDVDTDPTLRQTMMQRANGRHTVPQIFIGETHVGGCDELFALERRGELDPLLAD
ncbi:glutaredoxin 3 [Marinobacterium lutimaris]|uniref:Glutaredoxin n=1 Tax=Marinobacterium lutimaris TaxID=568106 RepID=A0A1H6D2Q8_9GAMM|nr:glutaredoxin 3 [Marinobacterium lutimaris]SEG79288.1 glutaredoxin 3 [Marinobacterium lutimaris]